MKLLKVLTVVCLVAAASALGQKEKKTKETDKWPVDVRVNLMVLDASRNYVDDIKASDVKIFEGGVEQKVMYFAKKKAPTHVAFVLDGTGSMRTQIDVEVSLARVVAVNLGSADEAMVVRFVSRDKITLEQPWTTQKEALNKTFDNLYIEGGQSAILDGVYLAAQKIKELEKSESKEKDKHFAIVLITDGEDRDSYYTSKDLFSAIEGTDIPIFVIGLTKNLEGDTGHISTGSRERAEKLLNTLAVRSGGAAYVFSKKYTKEDLEAAVRDLVIELRSQYVVGYTSTDQSHDNKSRPLRVEIADGPKGEKRTGIVRASYAVPAY